jgi:glycosyltransferase involved in cell wall biosynthesis
MHFSTTLEEERARALRILAPAIIEPNGIDLDDFRNLPTPGSFRRRSNIDEDVPMVLFLGRIHPKKGLDLLIPAFAEGAPSNAVLAIVGSGDVHYEAELRRLVSALGIERRVRFAGFLRGRDRVAAYADSNVYVLPSYSENFANTVLESLAAGTPVIVSDQVGLHAEVGSSVVGGVVPATVGALTEEIRRWLTDSQRRDLARARASNFLKQYDVNRVANRWLRRYRKFSFPANGEAA